MEDYDPADYKVLFIYQQDTRAFNCGAMKNIGFITVKNMYPNDYQNITLVFNDVDTLPYTKNFLNYKTTQGTIKHFYGFIFCLGGIVSVNAGDFERINGFPNFCAWGYEDNMLQARAQSAGLIIDRSQFYSILDKNILHFNHGITRNVNRKEYDAYKANTPEGINTIYQLATNYEESTGFVNVTNFITNRQENSSNTMVYDIRNGPRIFKSKNKRAGMIKMFL